jgi:hypothetical protein
MTSDLPRIVQIVARIIPAADRLTIVGDLVEDADFQHLCGFRRGAWLARECGAIALGLSLERTRGWFVIPPMRELAAGLAIDGRCALRGAHPAAALFRAAVFCGSVAALVLGVELLVGSLLSAAGF